MVVRSCQGQLIVSLSYALEEDEKYISALLFKELWHKDGQRDWPATPPWWTAAKAPLGEQSPLGGVQGRPSGAGIYPV